MSKNKNKAHASAAAAAEEKAIDAAPQRPTPDLDALLAADEAARKPQERKARKATAARGPTFEAQIAEAVCAAGRPIKVRALVSWWCDGHPELGRDAKAAVQARQASTEARGTAEAAEARGEAEVAAEARERAQAAEAEAAQAARAQAEATTAARIYTMLKRPDCAIALVAKGEVQAKAAAA